MRLTVVFLAISLAMPAAANDGGLSIAVVAVGKDSPSASPAIVTGQIARQGFARNPRYSVLDIEAVLNGGEDRARAATLKRAGEALERGQAAYDAFELDPALEALAEAVVTYEQALGGLGDIGPVVDALTFEGAAYALKGDVKNAKRAFARAFTLDDTAALDGGRFPDTVVALFEEARVEANGLPTGSMTIYAAPAAAEVWIDGGFRGSAPMTVSDLKVGRHYVRVVRDGYVAFGEAVDVKRGAEETVQATLRPTTALSRFEDLRGKVSDLDEVASRELAAMLKVDQLLVLSVEQQGTNVSINGNLVDGVGGGALGTASKAFAFDSPRFRGDLEIWLADSFRKEGSATSTTGAATTGNQSYLPDAPVDAPTPGMLIAGYTFIGLTVIPVILASVSGILGIYYWDFFQNGGKLLANITGNPAQGIPNQFAREADEGQAAFVLLGVFTIAADVLWVVSAATLAAGITMTVIGLNQKAEIDDVLADDARASNSMMALLENAE